MEGVKSLAMQPRRTQRRKGRGTLVQPWRVKSPGIPCEKSSPGDLLEGSYDWVDRIVLNAYFRLCRHGSARVPVRLIYTWSRIQSAEQPLAIRSLTAAMFVPRGRLERNASRAANVDSGPAP
jgi:hypothetical protein